MIRVYLCAGFTSAACIGALRYGSGDQGVCGDRALCAAPLSYIAEREKNVSVGLILGVLLTFF